MKKKLSDLLDAYGDPNIELEIPTPLSSERIKELTMSKIKKDAPTKARTTFRVVMAAAIIAGLALSVFAATSAAAWFQAFFASENDSELSNEQMELIEQSAVAIDRSQTVDGYTIHVESVLNDEQKVYVKLDLYAPEGVALPYEERFFEQMGLYTHDGAQVNDGWGLGESIDADKTDNHVEILMTFDIADPSLLLSDGGVSLVLTNLYREYGSHFSRTREMLAEGTWNIDLTFGTTQEQLWEYEVLTDSVPCTMVKYHTGEETEISLTSICLRPLTIDVVYDYPDGADLEPLNWMGVKIFNKDGTVINVMPSDGTIRPEADQVTGYMTLQPMAPIILEAAAYIQFPDGTQIPVTAEE